MTTAQPNTTVVSLRVPLDLASRIEEFTNESDLERPSHAMRILLESALEQHDRGKIDVDRLGMLQHNATAEALAFVYETLGEVVERVVKR